MINAIAEPLQKLQPALDGLLRHEKVDVAREARHLIKNNCMSVDDEAGQLFLQRPLNDFDGGVQTQMRRMRVRSIAVLLNIVDQKCAALLQLRQRQNASHNSEKPRIIGCTPSVKIRSRKDRLHPKLENPIGPELH